MGCCTSSQTDAPSSPQVMPLVGGSTSDNSSGYFIHSDPTLEDCVMIEFNLRVYHQRNVLEPPIVRASKRRMCTPRSGDVTHGLSAGFEPGTPHTASTAYNKGTRRVTGSSNATTGGWGSSNNNMSTRSSMENDSLDNCDEVEAELARLDEEVSLLRGTESIGDAASEVDPATIAKKCRRIVKRAMESQGINDDPDQFDPCPEPLTVIAASIRRARRWVHSLPSYPLAFAPALSYSDMSTNDGSGVALSSATFTRSVAAYPAEFTDIAYQASSGGATRDVKPCGEATPSASANGGN